MHKISVVASLCLLVLFSIIACKKEVGVYTPVVIDKVSVDLTKVPYQKLSEYKFFDGDMKNQIPTEGVIEYKPASSLFTDYALKKRFIWMPQGTKGSFVSDAEILNLPVGSALIKNFYYDNVQPGNTTRIIETRIMIRKSTGWIFAEYIWNDEQTEAYLDMSGSYTEVSWLESGDLKSTNYRIPSETECMICHKMNEQPIPIGIKPQNLNVDFNYPDGTKNQLQKLISVGYLTNNLPGTILTTVDYRNESESLELRLRSYLDINCAHCHSENSHCDYRPIRLGFSETGNHVNMGLCVEPDEFIDASLTYIITPSNVQRSMMHFRLSSVDESNKMPLLGRSLVHEEGVQLLEDWINSVETCD